MLIFDTRMIGNKLLEFRKKAGLTQAEAAELSGLSDRAYADIERGSVNMRTETLLRICKALNATPNDIITDSESVEVIKTKEELIKRLDECDAKQLKTILRLISAFLDN